ncbi:DNA primase [Litoribacillus peritrichatus]|uniref:DNA primase n=1 Tax=Litoribacillus peritrichatus TaxID=718191 RepID=A0ABP7LYG8_9GAMM
MAGRIPDLFIDDVVAKTDLVELIGNRIKLKKSGSNHMGLCPFHNEKSPSFSVSDSKQLYHCFGCGASGNALTFLIEHDRLDFVEAIETLASSLGIEVPREENHQHKEEYQQKKQEEQKLFELMEKASHFFQQQLRHHPSKDKAVQYLKGRGMTGHTAKAFGIGYIPVGWDNLLKTLGTDSESRQLLHKVGMLIEKEQGKDQYYDRFRDRIMFPILDTRGRTVAFGGRVLGDDKPKYLNSPETPIFHKSNILYGLYQARKANRHPAQLIVVEGYMDVIALAQYGFNNAVASLGTALTEEHVKLLFKQTSQLVFCFDGDTAGQKAAKKALELSLSQLIDGREVKFLFLDEGEDPDTVVSKGGKEAFETTLNQALTIDQYLFSLYESANASLEGKAKLAKELTPLIQQVPGEFLRNLLTKELARKTGLNEDTLLKQQKPEKARAFSGQKSQTPNRERTSKPQSESTFTPPSSYDYPDYQDISSQDSGPYLEHYYEEPAFVEPAKQESNKLTLEAIRILLHQPTLISELSKELLKLDTDNIYEAKLLAVINHLKSSSETKSTAQLLGYFQDVEHFDILQQAMSTPPLLDEIHLSGQLNDIINHLNKIQLDKQILELKEKITNKTATEDEKRLFFQRQQERKNIGK